MSNSITDINKVCNKHTYGHWAYRKYAKWYLVCQLHALRFFWVLECVKNDIRYKKKTLYRTNENGDIVPFPACARGVTTYYHGKTMRGIRRKVKKVKQDLRIVVKEDSHVLTNGVMTTISVDTKIPKEEKDEMYLELLSRMEDPIKEYRLTMLYKYNPDFVVSIAIIMRKESKAHAENKRKNEIEYSLRKVEFTAYGKAHLHRYNTFKEPVLCGLSRDGVSKYQLPQDVAAKTAHAYKDIGTVVNSPSYEMNHIDYCLKTLEKGQCAEAVVERIYGKLNKGLPIDEDEAKIIHEQFAVSLLGIRTIQTSQNIDISNEEPPKKREPLTEKEIIQRVLRNIPHFRTEEELQNWNTIENELIKFTFEKTDESLQDIKNKNELAKKIISNIVLTYKRARSLSKKQIRFIYEKEHIEIRDEAIFKKERLRRLFLSILLHTPTLFSHKA